MQKRNYFVILCHPSLWDFFSSKNDDLSKYHLHHPCPTCFLFDGSCCWVFLRERVNCCLFIRLVSILEPAEVTTRTIQNKRSHTKSELPASSSRRFPGPNRVGLSVGLSDPEPLLSGTRLAPASEVQRGKAKTFFMCLHAGTCTCVCFRTCSWVRNTFQAQTTYTRATHANAAYTPLCSAITPSTKGSSGGVRTWWKSGLKGLKMNSGAVSGPVPQSHPCPGPLGSLAGDGLTQGCWGRPYESH